MKKQTCNRIINIVGNPSCKNKHYLAENIDVNLSETNIKHIELINTDILNLFII